MNRQLMQNNRGKGRLKYLLQQTELFAHFAKGDQSSSQKKSRGRYIPKIYVNYPMSMSICLLFFLCSCSEFYCIWHLNDNISYTFKSLKFFKRVHINSYMLGGHGNHRDKLGSTNQIIDTLSIHICSLVSQIAQ